jgi:hypothetical protein
VRGHQNLAVGPLQHTSPLTRSRSQGTACRRLRHFSHPTAPTYSEDEQEAAEAAEIQRALLQLTPERLKDLDHVHDPMPLDVGDPRNGGGNGVNNQDGF